MESVAPAEELNRTGILRTERLTFESFVDGERDLRESTGIFASLTSLTHSAWINVQLARGQYCDVLKGVSIGKERADLASEVFYDLCEQGTITPRQIVELVGYGADVNHRKNGCGIYPIHFLAEKLAYERVDCLCAVGVNCTTQEDGTWATPLISACSVHPSSSKRNSSAQVKTVKILLMQQPVLDTINHADSEGNTALDFAIAGNAVWVVKALVTMGASVMHAKIHVLLQTERRERTKLSQYYVDCEASDVWVAAQVLRHGAFKVCRGLVQFKLRMELRTSVSTLAVRKAQEDSMDLSLRDTAATVVAMHASPAANINPLPSATRSDEVIVEISPEQRAARIEERRLRRQQSKAAKLQLRQTKEQSALEKEREVKRLEFLKRVENQYKVSFQGLFPR